MYRLLFLSLIILGSCTSNGNGEYITMVKPGTKESRLRDIFSSYGVSDLKMIGFNIYRIKLDKDPGLDKIKKTASAHKEIITIEPNRKIRLVDPLEDKYIEQRMGDKRIGK